MKRLVSVVGARPQFIKVAVIAREARGQFEHIIIHTGQHYDARMSDVFFDQLGIPAPDLNLEVGSGSHGDQTGEMLKRLEPQLAQLRPDWLLLYGDTNSTLAGAVAGAKLGIPMAHVEAGLRSFNRRMPEEINRVVADHLSDLLFCPTQTATDNLAREGLRDRAMVTGDVMYDAILYGRQHVDRFASHEARRWHSKQFVLATIHRAENTDLPKRLSGILSGLDYVSREIAPVVLPLHPRTRKQIDRLLLTIPPCIHVCEPAPFMDMVWLETHARMILTDSGGVQKEAYFAQTPCITLRDETEWVETLENGCNVLAGADPERMIAAARAVEKAGPWTATYGCGDAGARILAELK